MNFNFEIKRYSILHSCKECVHKESCPSGEKNLVNPYCSNFLPSNIDNFLNKTILHMTMHCPKSSDKYLKRCCRKSASASSDGVTTLDAYYVDFINDSISQLRKGHKVYVFKLNHIKDIIPYFSDFTAKYIDGIFELRPIKNK